MKQLNKALLVALMCPLLACPKLMAGTQSGGGGGTLPPDAIDKSVVSSYVAEARNDILLYIKAQLRFIDPAEATATEKKIYFASPNIYDVLLATNVEIEKDKSCKDRSGQDVDASVVASKSNAICISAQRIAPKLSPTNARPEISALLFHELSHKLGTTEAEAVELQKDLRSRLSGFGQVKTADAFLENLKDPADNLSRSAWRIINDQSKMDVIDLREASQDLTGHAIAFIQKENEYPFSLTNGQERDYFSYIIELQGYAHVWMGAFLEDGSSYYKEQLAKYEKAFSGKSEITFRAISQATVEADFADLAEIGKNPFADEKIRRIQNLDDAKFALVKVARFFAALASLRGEIELEVPSPMPLPATRQSPFKKFVGEYSVKKVTCTDSMPQAQTFIIENSNGTIGLIERGNSYQSWLGSLHAGVDATTVSGGANWAERTKMNGNRWDTQSDRSYEETTYRMERSKNGFRLVKKWYSLRAARFSEHQGECVFELSKVK